MSPTSIAYSIVVCGPANTTSATASKSSVRVKEPDSSAAFFRESIRRVAIIGMKIALELLLHVIPTVSRDGWLGDGGG